MGWNVGDGIGSCFFCLFFFLLGGVLGSVNRFWKGFRSVVDSWAVGLGDKSFEVAGINL